LQRSKPGCPQSVLRLPPSLRVPRRFAPRNEEVTLLLFVIASGSEAIQRTSSLMKCGLCAFLLDCFVAMLLAMTKKEVSVFPP
jgi:hypothetical protein